MRPRAGDIIRGDDPDVGVVGEVGVGLGAIAREGEKLAVGDSGL